MRAAGSYARGVLESTVLCMNRRSSVFQRHPGVKRLCIALRSSGRLSIACAPRGKHGMSRRERRGRRARARQQQPDGADLRANGELYARYEIIDELQRLSRTLTQRAVLAQLREHAVERLLDRVDDRLEVTARVR